MLARVVQEVPSIGHLDHLGSCLSDRSAFARALSRLRIYIPGCALNHSASVIRLSI